MVLSFDEYTPISVDAIQRYACEAVQTTNKGIIVVAEAGAWADLRDWMDARAGYTAWPSAPVHEMYVVTQAGKVEILMLSRPGKRWAIYPEMV